MVTSQFLRTTSTGQRLLIAGLLLVTGILGYLRLSTSFAPYDDEGYVMVSLQSFIDGKPLYDATYSQYGPGYFFLNGWFHRLTGLPISHDTARLKMLVVWVLSAGATGWATFRLSGQRWLGLIAYSAAWFHLDRLGFEPGHPQDLCFAAIAASLLIACQRTNTGGVRIRQAVVLGMLAGITAMTKINIGVFLLVIATTTVVALGRSGRARTWLLTLIGVGAAALPVAIAKQHVLSWEGIQLPATVVLGWVGLAIVFYRREQSGTEPAPHPMGEPAIPETHSDSSTVGTGGLVHYASVLAVWIGFIATVAAFCGLALADGTSLRGLYFGLIGQHSGVIDQVYEHPPLHPFAIAVCALGACLAWFLTSPRRSARSVATARRIMTFGFIAVLAGIGLRYITDSATLIDHGADDRGHAGLLLSVLPGFAWLVLLQSRKPGRRTIGTWLAVSSVVLPMCPYPVPGTQTAMASLTLLILLFVVLSNAIEDWGLTSDDRRFCTRAIAATGVLCCICFGIRATQLGKTYRNSEPIKLAGASRLRLEPGFVAQTRWTVHQLRTLDAATFFCIPSGHNSLFRWAEIAPPTGQNATVWESLLPEPQQQEILASLRSHRHPVIVWNTGDQADDLSNSGPLRSYIEQNFEPVTRRGDIEIHVRRQPSTSSELGPISRATSLDIVSTEEDTSSRGTPRP